MSQFAMLIPWLRSQPQRIVFLCIALSLLSAFTGHSPDGASTGQEKAKPNSRPNIPFPVESNPPKGIAKLQDPDSLNDLKKLETTIQDVAKHVSDATVNVIVGQRTGSGVVVSKQGHILTAAHVAVRSNSHAQITFANAKRANAIVLGVDRANDIALLRIQGRAEYVPCSFADPSTLSRGDWVLATGHPGGPQKDRPPVLRLGRILSKTKKQLCTDCTLWSGDSGGPLFDLSGNVIGVNLGSGTSAQWNLHCSVETIQSSWERLQKSESWGEPFRFSIRPILGISGVEGAGGLKVTRVQSNSPAALAGIFVDDVIATIDGHPIKDSSDIDAILSATRSDAKVEISFMRKGQVFTVVVKPVVPSQEAPPASEMKGEENPQRPERRLAPNVR